MRFLLESKNDYQELYYDNLKLDLVGPNEEEYTENVSYTYEVDREDIKQEFIYYLMDENENIFDNMSDEEVDNYLEDNYDDLFDEYENRLLDHFEEDAREYAEDTYEDPEYDYWDEVDRKVDEYILNKMEENQ